MSVQGKERAEEHNYNMRGCHIPSATLLQCRPFPLQPLRRLLLRRRCCWLPQRLNRDVAPFGAGVAAELDAALDQRVNGVVAALLA